MSGPISFPGVFVEEIDTGNKPIEGVPTSTCGFVGITERGPVQPALITSFAEYLHTYGGYFKEDGKDRYLTYGIEGFFQNGGSRCFVARVISKEAATNPTDFADALARLGKIDEIALLCCPDENNFPPITAALIAQCESLKYRFAILQAPHPAPAPDTHHPPQASKYAAYYYPWLRIPNPINQVPMEIPPGGHIAGIYARTDLERGVHRAPANEIIRGLYLDPHDPAAGLTVQVTKAEQELLNPRGVNVLRHFAGKGNLVWGARTTSPDPDWKYVNVRRLFIFVEESIEEGTKWVVFEPNGEPLWARVSQSVSTFLRRLWMNGMLQGKTEHEAYFVRCDRTTMTQDDIDNGRLIVLIGMAPIKPAEFVIFRIGQWAGGSAHRIKAVAKWDDLVLPEEQLRALHDIASHVREGATVIKEWSFPEKDSRGSGITALFAGASGTGKSMAAEVLANELGLDLYRIDLAAVVNKFIGETEKNLKRLFDAAEKGGAILFFDEADALFGKRTEVKDSHDRFANIETNYFLQRLDHYRGLVILATKVKSALDAVFLRRLRFVVNFPDADAAHRA
ncbi:MAG: hypothetical protein DLM73_17455 [Chthoniobacterales bacterium]|nr:MAG: hypothetical protein DLM73_17455 [Chthoniobacterales bacterium]